MKNHFAIGLSLMLVAVPTSAQTNAPRRAPARPLVQVQTTNDLGWITNGPATLESFRITQSWTNRYASTNPGVAMNPMFLKLSQSTYTWTNLVFEAYRPESLSHVIWTNFLAQTNGRNLLVWSARTHPSGWPTNPPGVTWNTNSVIWGMKGVTALSPCWQGEVNSGQVPLTALSRRHAYTRGHQLGTEGLNERYAGFKAWFVTTNNSLVEVRIKRMIIRTSKAASGAYRDYTIALFDRDLPDSIGPMRVVSASEVQSKYPVPTRGPAPHPDFQTEQGGHVSTGVAPLAVNTWKGGDSGSPNMLPLPGELVFYSGRSTSGPSREMQADMDELCRTERLNPKKYQLRWVDLSRYPSY